MVYSRIDESLGRALSTWVDWVARHATRIVVVTLLLTALFLAYATAFLGVNMDHVSLLDKNLPFRKTYAEFAKMFPILDNALLVVVDGETSELVRESTTKLAERLEQRKDLFTDVFVPGAGPFFDHNALLYLSVDELTEFADKLALMQPLIAELLRDDSIANLARLVEKGLEQAHAEGRDAAEWPAVLDQLSDATVAVYQEFPVAISWESLLLEGSALDPTRRRVIILQPKLNFDSLLPAAPAMSAIRAEARDLGLTRERGVRVRITGNPALNNDEMIGLAWNIGAGSLFSFALVVLALYLALRSPRLVVASVVTLLVGLVWTAAFATAAVGYLNLLSICFAVLFIGLGVDFAIHLGMRYAHLLRHGASHAEAQHEAVTTVGSSLVLCTLTTAIGFWVFIPTPYRGVAELGLIAGTGMLISLFQTLTLFPALLSSWLRVDPRHPPRSNLHFHTQLGKELGRRPGAVALVALLLGIGSAALVPSLRFDSNIIEMRAANTESVQAFNDLLTEQDTSPWNIDVMAPNLDSAEEIAQRLRKLDIVDRAVTLRSFVPENQDEKLDILANIAVLLDVPPAPARDGAAPPSVEDQVRALQGLHDFLDAPWLEQKTSKLAASVRLLRDELGKFLQRVKADGRAGPELAKLESLLLGNLPQQIDRLRTALDASEVTIDDLPKDLVRRMLAPDGRARIQVYARENLTDMEHLAKFADAVSSIAPNITGLAINVYEFGRVTVRSMIQALISAFVVITLLLWALFRRVSDVLLVLAPLVLGAVFTGAAMVLFGLAFNFANVVVLPLLLGIGVDSGIHLVHRSWAALRQDEDLLETTTARAVFYSAMTTIVSFGSLAFSSHTGVSSLGKILVLGMVLMLACNLLVLPALLALRQRIRPSSFVETRRL